MVRGMAASGFQSLKFDGWRQQSVRRRKIRGVQLATCLLVAIAPILVGGFHIPTTTKRSFRRVGTECYALDSLVSFLDPVLVASSNDPTANVLPMHQLPSPAVLFGSLSISSIGLANSILSKLPLPVVLAGLLLATPVVVAAIQGGSAVVNFRKNYADAPLPKIPCHGLVIAGDSAVSPEDESLLRLLVIGDSLAVGVGQSVSCTPVMPEAIASQISKSTGKAVIWTCFGETGASTPWIIRMIEEADTQKVPEFQVVDEPGANGYLDFQAEGNLSSTEIHEWKKKLFTYRQSFRELYFDPDSWGHFDIVVLVTGTNDLKAAIFPFLLDEEDKELRRQIKARKGGLVEDVELFIETLNRKMEKGLQARYNKFMESAEELSETIRRGIEDTLEEMESYFEGENITDSVSHTRQANSTEASVDVSRDAEPKSVPSVENVSFVSPLFVLPGSPIRIVPAFRRAPLEWFGVPVFDFMDEQKKEFAKSNPSDILFVEDPTPRDAIDYESQCGRLWNEKSGEKLLLRVKDVSGQECDGIEAKMKAYYDSKDVLYDTVHSETPLSDWPGEPGTNVFSVDSIHPNEAGELFKVFVYSSCHPFAHCQIFILILTLLAGYDMWGKFS